MFLEQRILKRALGLSLFWWYSWKFGTILNLAGALPQHMVFFKWRHKCSCNICSCGLIFTLAWYFLNMLFTGNSIHSPESEYKAWMHVAQTPECLLHRAELTPTEAREWSYSFPLLYMAATANHSVWLKPSGQVSSPREHQFLLSLRCINTKCLL